MKEKVLKRGNDEDRIFLKRKINTRTSLPKLKI